MAKSTNDRAPYSHILSFLNERVWAITPQMMATINAVVEMRVRGERLSSEAIQSRLAEVKQDRTLSRVKGPSVAVLPVFGVLGHRMNMVLDISGGTSTQMFARDFRSVMRDDSIGAVILDVDSPGGSVEGIPELWAEMMSLRGTKPVVAVANTFMASGAYYIASAADRIVASPSAEVGSIGVIAQHLDFTKQNDMVGLKVTTLRSTDSPFKGEFNPDEELSPDDRDRLQVRLDEIHEEFIRSIAKGRGVPMKKVNENFGRGRVLSAKEALDVGMVDEIETFDAVVSRMSNAGKRNERASLSGVSGDERNVDLAAAELEQRRRRARSRDRESGLTQQDSSV